MSIFVNTIAFGILAFLWVTYVFYSLRKQINLTRKLHTTENSLQDEISKKQRFSFELTEIKNQLNQNLFHDLLTGLPSRQVLEDRLLQTVNQSKRYQLTFGVLFLDIDGFKVINTALGYDIGDILLKEVALRLQGAVRQVDTVCRFSGDEYVVLLPQIAKAETCVYIAQRLLDTISQPFHINNQDLFITASIGISVYPNDGNEGKILLKNADNALHQAKSRGCNTYQFFREEMQALSQRELVLNACLHDMTIYQEFSIFYQPLVDIQNKKIMCMEALLRWQHPQFGLITPQEFLRLAENSGKIIEIGEWVLRTVCQQFQKWNELDVHPKTVAVNISLRQLENPHFVYKVSQILQETNMKADALILEISEGAFHKIDLLEKTLQMLKRLGIQIAIDDFGTGHLSLQQLKRLPVNFLKIDGSFVQDIATSQESDAIVKMVIALAKGLQQGVIAEGVETQEQKASLELWGCHMMQGHLFSIPRKADEFTSASDKIIGEK